MSVEMDFFLHLVLGHETTAGADPVAEITVNVFWFFVHVCSVMVKVKGPTVKPNRQNG